MREPARILVATFAALILLVGSVAGGFILGRASVALLPVQSQQPDPTADLTIFWETWNYLQQEFYPQPLDREELVRGAVRGLLESTGDQHTGYMDPEAFRMATQDLGPSFEGIGAEVGIRDERVVIVSPLPDSPAERAGVRPGDVIVRIDGEDARRLDLLEAVRKIRGPRGTTVTLTVQRLMDPIALDASSREVLLAELPALEDALRANDAERAREVAARVNDALGRLSGATVELDIPIVRDTIVFVRVEHRMLDDGIAYLRLAQFSRGASTQVDAALAELMAEDPRGLVFDLRRNSGGLVDEAVSIASQFLPAQSVVFVEERAGDVRREFRARGGGRATDVPIVVLVDNGSASASEIVAGALRDHGRAQLVGIATFGKGSEQLWHELSDGSGIRVTIARWLTPGGTWVVPDGLVPDHVVEDPDRAEPDLALERAVELLRDR